VIPAPAETTISPPVAPVIARLPPAMNAALSTWPVEAISPPTFTSAVPEKSTPFALSTATMPLAVSLPAICEGAVPPVTRFSAIALALGCAKATCASRPISKLFHSMIARFEDCVTSSRADGEGAPIVAVPATTVPPVGNASAACPSAGCAAARAQSPADSISIVRQRRPAGAAFMASGALVLRITTSTQVAAGPEQGSVCGAECHEHSAVAVAPGGDVAVERLGVLDRCGNPGFGAHAKPAAGRAQALAARLAGQRVVLADASAFVIGKGLHHPEARGGIGVEQLHFSR